MTENEQLNSKDTSAPEDDRAQEVAPAPKNPKPEMSRGEKRFDSIVYTGINYWTNLILSLGISDYFTNLAGRKSLDSWIEKATVNVSKMLGASKMAVHGPVKNILETLTLLTGGILVLFPMMHLENHKREYVHKLNKMMGVPQTAPDGHEETPEEIHIENEQPKQTVGGVIWRRVLATIAVCSASLSLDKFFKDKKNLLDPEKYVIGGEEIVYNAKPLGGNKRATNWIVGKINEGLKHVPVVGEKVIAHQTTQRWLALAALDVFFTVITKVVMKATNGTKKVKLEREIDDSNDPKGHEVNHHIVVDEQDLGKPQAQYASKVGKRETTIKKPSENFVGGLGNQEAVALGLL